jgi:hypothetical protein
VRRRKRRRATVFNGSGVAPVVVDLRGGVLQHRCERGKLGLAPIWEWRGSEGAHRRGERQRRRSDGVWRGGVAPVTKTDEVDAWAMGTKVHCSGVDG